MCVCVTEDPGEGLSQGHSQASTYPTQLQAVIQRLFYFRSEPCKVMQFALVWRSI